MASTEEALTREQKKEFTRQKVREKAAHLQRAAEALRTTPSCSSYEPSGPRQSGTSDLDFTLWRWYDQSTKDGKVSLRCSYLLFRRTEQGCKVAFNEDNKAVFREDCLQGWWEWHSERGGPTLRVAFNGASPHKKPQVHHCLYDIGSQRLEVCRVGDRTLTSARKMWAFRQDVCEMPSEDVYRGPPSKRRRLG